MTADNRLMTADKMTDRGRPMTTQADTAHAPILPGADDYEAFLRAKAALAPLAGFEVADGEINPLLLPHQRAIVRWACRPGFRQINLATALKQARMGAKAGVQRGLSARVQVLHDPRPRVRGAGRTPGAVPDRAGRDRRPPPRAARGPGSA